MISCIISLSNPFVVKSLYYQIPSFDSKSTCVLSRWTNIFLINVFKVLWLVHSIIKSHFIKSIHYQIPSFLKKKVLKKKSTCIISRVNKYFCNQCTWWNVYRGSMIYSTVWTQIFTDMIGEHGWVRVNKYFCTQFPGEHIHVYFNQ